jgi:ssDNA thymidine ADP-ribosyltransferase, DarT
MSPVPEHAKIFHITPVNNLPKIVSDGVLWSDAERIRQGLPCEVVGMTEIKRRRLEEIEVDCHPGTHVGNDVPFYFCPRSVMLYILHRGNNPGLSYKGGQGPIVHLCSDLQAVLQWLQAQNIRWAFSRVNAGAYYADFFNDAPRLADLDWESIAKNDWRDPDVKEAKQGEFLVERSFPWHLVETIGVLNASTGEKAEAAISTSNHKPRVAIERSWYY